MDLSSEWKNCALGDILTFQRGYDLPKSKMSGGKFPVIGSNGIIGWHDEYTTEAPGITVGRSGNVGKPFIINKPSWSHNTTLFIKKFKNSDPTFIYYFLKTLKLKEYAGRVLSQHSIKTIYMKFQLKYRLISMKSKNC